MRLSLVGLFLACCAAPAQTRPCAPRNDAPPSAPAPTPPQAPSTCAADAFGVSARQVSTAWDDANKRRGTVGKGATQIVAASHRLATDAGLAVLHEGGNAVDAFVAAALVDDVVFPGVTSLAGVAGILVYEAKSKTVTYVHGALADPVDPARRLKKTETVGTESGRLVLVPGAPLAYAEVTRRFGRRSLRDAVEPAAELASRGFAIDHLYAMSILHEVRKLEASSFGRATFFRAGRALREGDTLVLDETAQTLRAFGKDPRWFSKGPWVTEAVRVANEHGGSLAAGDFAAASVEVGTALRGEFMGYEVFTGGFGGATLLASLGALERLRAGRAPGAFTRSADDLELLLRVTNHARRAPIVTTLSRRGLVAEGAAADALVADTAKTLAERARAELRAPLPVHEGSHSSAVVVVDQEGNVVVGTHSIETLNWGEGLFAFGIPLSTSGRVMYDDPAAAARTARADALSDSIVFKDGVPRAALAVYGSGLFPADVQVLDAVLARGLGAEDAVLEPRVGTVDWSQGSAVEDVPRRADPRFELPLLCEMKRRGLRLSSAAPPESHVDTGFPTLVTIGPDGLRGMTPDAPFVHGVAAGD